VLTLESSGKGILRIEAKAAACAATRNTARNHVLQIKGARATWKS
jgi:hypothetical protein